MKNIVIALYIVFLLFLTVFSYSFIDPGLFYFKDIYTGFSFQNRAIVTGLYVLCICMFFLFYFFFSWKAYKNTFQIRDVLWLVGITIGMLFFSYPAMLSYDIFNYITTAKVTFFYMENPYVVMPIEFIAEPFLSYTHAANKIAQYGPMWIILTGIPYFLSFGTVLVMLYGFKIFVGIFYIATIVLLWKMTKNLFSIVLFALNPLIVIETLVSGHNDIVMMFFALLSFYLLKKKAIALGSVALIISVCIKYATIFLLPIFVFVIWSIFQKRKIHWDTIFVACTAVMFLAFILSPLREEIYPWYALWFLAFVSLIPHKKTVLYSSIAFSFGLLLRYVPFMLIGSYLDPTPIIKNIVSFTPLVLLGFYYVFKKKV